jgi:hypothetical protein
MGDLKLLELQANDLATIGACVRAAAYGPFFPDREIHALVGFDRGELRRIAEHWPPSEPGTDAESAAWGCLNNLLGYPHGHWDVWSEFIPATPDEIRLLFDRWVARQDPRPPRPSLWSEEDLAKRRAWLTSIDAKEGRVSWPNTWPDSVRRAIGPFVGRDDSLVITFPSEIAGDTFTLSGHVFRYLNGVPMIVADRSGAPNVHPVTFGAEVPTRIELRRGGTLVLIYPP